MSEILLCNQPLSPQSLKNQCGVSINQLASTSCPNPSMAVANTPYLIDSDNSRLSQGILNQLSSPQTAKEITNLSLSYGEDDVLALAEVIPKLQEYNLGLIGASTSVYANRIGGFAGAVKRYQDSLLNYRQAVGSKSPASSALKQKAVISFNDMQSQFRHELNVVNGQVKSRRGTPLTSAERGTNIARSSRNAVKLNLTSQIQANNLVKLSRQAKYLGNGLAVIDFGSRVGNIHNSYQSGGNWERDLFIESSSFAASAVTGTAVVNAGAAALGLLVVATPIGWVGLIVGGLAVAGTAAAASIAMNGAIKDNSGGWYDSIMKALGT